MSLAFLWLYFLAQKTESSDVLDMISQLPEVETGNRPGAWTHFAAAGPVAEAIASVAPDRATAARMAVYAVYEGGLRACAVGDHGRSLGPWQLQGVGRAVACDPVKAAKVWLALAELSEKVCAKSPADERLAYLASGSCHRGRELVRRRERLARGISIPEE